ncbi:unnamed protein product [Symbiodinium sp. CCMP2592]|nr:unnamed protein product [Symbiodinium sp. CCMP2592]
MVPWPLEPEPVPGMDEEMAVCDVITSPGTLLSEDVDPLLIRGVPLDLCMQSWGTHFSTAESKNVNTRMRMSYSLSRTTDTIDCFLSHDWQTSRWKKTVALLVIFNSVPAAVTSVLVSTLASVLLCFDLLPGGWITGGCLGYFSFNLVFFFWQRLRRILCCRRTMVFFDRICIAQHDEHLKQEGILSLAGILAQSRKLVILWSPHYFTRLWCTFELGAFLKDSESEKPVEFLPVSVALQLLLQSAFMTALCLAVHISLYIEEAAAVENSSDAALLFFLIWVLPAGLGILPVLLHYGLQHLEDVQQLGEQLANFSVRDAGCTCCTVDHCDPATGNQLLCDRELIFRTLKRWYRNSALDSGEKDHHLVRFDALVRERLSSSVLPMVGAGVPPARYRMALYLPLLTAVFPHYLHLGRVRLRGWGVEHWFMAYGAFAATALLFFWLCFFCCRFSVKKIRKAVPRWVVIPFLQSLILLLTFTFWIPFRAVLRRTGSSLAGGVVMSCMWLILACIYSTQPLRACRKIGQ